MAIKPTRSIFRTVVLFVALGFLLAACGSPEVDTEASAELSYDELRSAVSPCPDGPPPSDIGYSVVFEQVEGWYKVDDYGGTPIPAIGTGVEPGELAVVSLETGELVTLDIVANPGAEAPIAWGVAQASALYLGVNSSVAAFDYAAVVMAELPDGSVFFPGECAEEFLGDPLRQNLGEEHSGFLPTALELTGTDLELYVSTSTSPR